MDETSGRWHVHGDEEAEVRRLLGLLRRSADEPVDDPAAGTGLDVPRAGAAEVIAVARRIAGGPARLAPPAPGLRLVAEYMVLSEHPSARDWTGDERHEVLRWVTLIIQRQGEDGVQRLIAELNEPPVGTRVG
jgi:hypothetical protein